jgi:hypothetical protein
VPGQPEIKVRFGTLGEIAQDTLLAHRFDDGQVGLVVPAIYGLGERQFCSCGDFDKVAVYLDMVFQRLILAGYGGAQVGVRPEPVEPGIIKKSSILCLYNQFFWPVSRLQRHPGFHFCHDGLDLVHSLLAGNRHAMVTVEHKIHLANLIDVNRRQIADVGSGRFNLRPPLFVGAPTGQERTREIAVAPDAADDGRDGNGLHAALGPAGDAQLVRYLLVG